jgi:hypothetical protein
MGGALALISTTAGVGDGTLGAMSSASGAAALGAPPNSKTAATCWCRRGSRRHRRRDLLVQARIAEAPTASFAVTVAATNEPAEVTQRAVKATMTAGTMEAMAGETATTIFPKQLKV